ncbi:siderophore-interacting protein [Cellulosimicrobium cellulans]|uniref:Siderophore-interacting protein n=1 Tax=Cellulosimicrobium cellulans TaxID=1710 RepID=A0A4Y4E075_CELCE|nr:siderophore-interacting protein [Cellulosimicrobium cellulans]GED11022.1 siderophore-interacting protein [Cellulosimicrobium cellulans]
MATFKTVKPADAHVVTLSVVGSKRVSPHVVRVTLGGDDMELFTPMGFDQWFRLFLARDDQDSLRLPTRTSGMWYVQYLATPKARRPWVRNYTVRAARPDLREIDVDFVVHGDAGPASSFALSAQPGDRVGLLDQGVGYNPRVPHDWTLVVTDETGLPAVAGICESLPDDARGLAIVEIPEAADAQDFRVPAGVELRWVVREGAAPAGTDAHELLPGALALEAVRSADLSSGPVYAYAVGESALATGVRRHLVNDRGVPKANIDFVGYWRHGHAASS